MDDFISLLRKAVNTECTDDFISLLRKAVNTECTCGGGEPGNCCIACMVWHRVVRQIERLKEQENEHSE
jgi:hypothetical protein